MELLVVVAILAVLLGLIFPAVQCAREAAARVECAAKMKQIALALHAYHDQNHRFPPAREDTLEFTGWLSWMHRLLPFIERNDLAVRTSWDDAFNGAVVPIFLCPSDPRDLSQDYVGQPMSGWGRFGLTSYLGVVGSEEWMHEPTNGVFDTQAPNGVTLASITDGASHTLMVGERPPSADKYWGWWAYSDYDNLLATRLNFHFYPGCEDPNVFMPGDVDDNCASIHFWSPHRGDGGNWAFADGSVRWLGYDGGSITVPLSTRAGGEIVEVPE